MIKLNGHIIEPTIFPDGTSQVWKIPEHVLKTGHDHTVYFHIEWDFQSESEIFHLHQIRDLIERVAFTTTQVVRTSLDMKYLPYARQDKEVSNNSTFARSTFFNIIKNMNLDLITTLDAHSDTGSLIEDVFPSEYIDKVFDKVNPSLVCFPDEGAKKRYGTYIGKFPNCSFSKERDQKTGYIKSLSLNENVDIKDKKVLVIDDICDGGMTFKLTAEKLLQCGAKEVILYTTHGIYSKGVQTLLDSGISRVFNYKGEVFPHKQTRFLLKEFK